MSRAWALACAAAAACVVVAGCAPSPEEELDALEQELLEEMEAGGFETPEPVYLDLDLEENVVEVAEGLTYTLGGFERGVSSWDDTPYLGFDITIANATGEVFDPAGVNVWVAAGPEGADAAAVVDPEGGVGREVGDGAAEGPAFGATVRDGEEVTVRFGYALEPEVERVEIRLQPWDVEGAPEVFVTGDVPRG